MNLYLEHFGLREAPFKITPTTEFFYGGGRRGEILRALQYAIDVGEGIMMLTGEVGSGKTMLLRTLSEKLPDNVELIYIANPSFSGREILYNICEELELNIDLDKPGAVRSLQNYLIERHTQGKRVVALIDEAQAMPDESLEEIRLLSNLETSRHKLLQIVLFGQPELLDKLSRQNMRQLRERITVALTLQPFNRDDIRDYISTRLHAAGYSGGELFAKDGCHLLAVVSQGLSRRINVLADKSLLSAFERGSDRVLYDDVKRAVKDAKFGRMRYRSERTRQLSRQITVGISIAACLVLLAAIGNRFGNFSSESAAVTAESTTPTLSPPAAIISESAPPPTITPESAAEELAEVVESAAAVESTPILPEPTPEPVVEPVVAAPVIAVESVELVESAPVKIITVTTVAQVTVAAAVESASEESPQTAAATGDEMASLIKSIHSGEDISGEQLLAEISLFAESHEAPPTSFADSAAAADWKDKNIREAGLVHNQKWHWMPENSYLRLRLSATETWMQDAGDGYTARIITVGQDRSVFLERFLRHYADFYPLSNLIIYPTRLNNRDRFVVTFGIYSSREDANVYIRNMPRYFIGGRPFVQSIAESIAESANHWQ